MISKLKQEKNYWPHAIVMVLIFMVFACAMVVKIAMDNPVQMDSFYLEKYQTVNEDINSILEKQKVFEEKFAIKYETEKFIIGKPNTFKMSIKDIKNNNLVKNAEIKLVLSRPDTNEFNQEFNLKSAVNGFFTIDNIKVNKPGRWQILTKIKIGDKSSYNQYEVYASK